MNDNQLFETLTLTVPGLVWVCDAQGRVEFNNAQWSEFTGLPQQHGLGHGWLDSIHPTDAAAFRARLPLEPSALASVQVEMRMRRHDGVYHRHLLNVRHVGDNKWVGCAIDAHDWLTTELRDSTQGNILDLIISGAELADVLAELCRAAERQIPGAVCSVLLVDAHQQIIEGGIAPHLPGHMTEAIRGVKIGPGVGSCGTAAFERRDIISADIATDPLWENWRELALPFGLRACWSQPVFASNGDVIATFGFYFRENRAPTSAESEELARLRGLASLAIERARTLEALRESEEHYRHTVEQSPQITWTSDAQGSILSSSSRWSEITGRPLKEALGDGWLLSLHPEDREPTILKWNEGLSAGTMVDFHYRVLFRHGEYRWARARAVPRRDQNGTIIRWYGTVEDVHEQYLANEKLKRQAYQDELTDLPNRRCFVDELKQHLASTSDVIGLMILDMDDFKLVNDHYGHLTGDAVLRLFARYLQRVVGPDEFIARLGGDEFAVIYRHIADDNDLLRRAQSIEAALGGYLKANKKTRSCQPSIGCALGSHGENPDEVFKRADLALYAAKATGKGVVKLFTPDIRSSASRRNEALELARHALREGWISPYYQPIVDLKDQRITGFEALLRIHHPEHGVLAPSTIHQALDDPRLAGDISIRMAQLVVGNIITCADDGIDCPPISINLATENLIDPDFVTELHSLLDGNGLERKVIKLEITERVLVDELGETVVRNLRQLRESGVRISLDDFGTGYASLVHLQSLPVDEIKIDRSFVSGLGTGANRGEIVQAMLGLAKSLNLTTVAEGIETPGEALKLTSWGCDLGQGYLFGRPMPFDEARRAMQRGMAPARMQLAV